VATDPAHPVAAGSAPFDAALLAPPDAPVLVRSSPHVLDLASFGRHFGRSPRRRALLAGLEAELGFLKARGVVPLCLLVGGGFVRDSDLPGDLDALVVYALDPSVGTDAARILLGRRPPGLDLRFVPGDVGPVPLMRMSCFFHTLYQSRDRRGEQASFLVTLDA